MEEKSTENNHWDKEEDNKARSWGGEEEIGRVETLVNERLESESTIKELVQL